MNCNSAMNVRLLRAGAIAVVVIACADATPEAADTAVASATGTTTTAATVSRPDAVATCTASQVDGGNVTACEVPPGSVARLQIAPAPRPAMRTWTMAALDSSVRANGRKIRVATNAGIFQKNGRPSGLLIRNGRELSKLAAGEGPSARDPNRCAVNFFCLPNGVFYVAGGRAHVATTGAFARSRPELSTIALATQSGPMLVAGGKVARQFPASFNKRIPRNAVCVRADGTVVFVLAESSTHATLADMLIARFHCRDAVFLDGNISSLYTGEGSPPALFDYAAIIYLATP